MKNLLIASEPLSLADAEKLGLIAERIVANRLEVPISTLRSWRESGRGPMSYQINDNEIAYLALDIEMFEDVCLDGFHRFFGSACPAPKNKALREQAAPKPKPVKHLSFSQWLKQERAAAKSPV